MHSRAEQLLKKQNLVKEKAKQLEKSLIIKRDEKLEQFKRQLKDKSLDNIQNDYQSFKQQIYIFFVSQLQSLKLQKEMKLSQVEDIQEEIRKAINILEGNYIKISQMQEQVERAECSAIQHLELNQRLQFQKLNEKLYEQMELKVNEYQQSIYIQ